MVSCGFVFDMHIDGPYRVVDVDTTDSLSLSYSLPIGDAIGRISDVHAIGWNDDYIVAQADSGRDVQFVDYYYLIRKLDSVNADPSISVRGPFTKENFLIEKDKLGLPDFKTYVP